MNSILLILNAGLVLACSAGLLACTRIRSRPAYLVGLYVLSYADIVLILELAGLLSAIQPSVVFVLQVLLTTVSILVWFRAGRPSMLGPFSGLKITRTGLAGVLRQARTSPLTTSLLVLLTGSVVYVYIRHAQLILLIPPDNWDSLTYHLSRVGYWLQYKSFYPWPTPNFRQTTWPMNAELGVLWTILWWGTDRLAGFVQWTTALVSMIGIYALVRLLGYSRWQGALAALLWATLPQVLSQSSTTQNDLVTTTFWAGTLLFLLVGVRQRERSYLFLSGIAFGLAMGAKSTSLFALPGLVLAVGVVIFLFHKHRGFQASMFRWAVACVLGFLFLGSYIYVQNSIAFGNALGPSSVLKNALGEESGLTAYPQRLRDNLARYTYQLVDFSPLPLGLASKLNPVKATFFSSILDRVAVSIKNPSTLDENASFDLQYINGPDGDTSWFGPLGAFLLVAVIYQGFQASRQGDASRLVLALTAMAFVVVDSAAQKWTPFKGRYYNIPIAVSFPLMACLLQTRPFWRKMLACLLTLVGLITVFMFLAKNEALARIEWRNPFAAGRVAPSWLSEFNYRMMSENVPATASIAVDSKLNFRDYPFFGEHFGRRVTLAIPSDPSVLPRVDTRRFMADFENSDYLFLAGGGSPFGANLALNEFRLLSSHDGDSLWMRNDPNAPEPCNGDKWPFSDFFQSSSAAVCPQFPIIPGTVANGFSQSSFLSTGQFVPVIGTGSHAQFEFGLVVKEAETLGFSIQVQSPNPKYPQTLLMVISGAGSDPKSLSAPFRGKHTLDFAVPLQAGSYRIQLGLAKGEQASINRFQVTTP